MNIGLTRKSYPEKRCITTSDKHSYFSHYFLNPLNYLKRLPYINKKIRDFVFIPVFNPKIDIYHCFNDICITNKDWVVSFETMLPRFLDLVNCHKQASIEYNYNEVVNSYLKKTAAPNCLQVIAISNSALKIQQELLESYPEVKETILAKTTVLYPPQKILIDRNDIAKKDYKKLKLIFIGRQFYLKGGSEVVQAIEELTLEKSINHNEVHLTIVGNLEAKDNEALGHFQDSQPYFDLIETIINARSNITHIAEIENDQLLEIIKQQDIGLLTTWADTFGYSVLEFQAGGCPVISTNIRTLPEINNPDIGWVINLETNKLGEIVIDSEDQKNITRRLIIDNLKSIIIDCLKNKETIRTKANKAFTRIEAMYCIDNYNKKLTEIYSLSYINN